MILWSLIAILAGCVLVLLLVPFRRRSALSGMGSLDGADERQFDIAVYKDQLAEVDRDQERGHLSPEQGETVKTEIQRRLLAAHDRPGPEAREPVSVKGTTGNLAAIMVVLCIPVLSTALYLHLGSPEVPGFPHGERDDLHAAAENIKNVEAMIAEIEARLATETGDSQNNSRDNPQDWAMLGRGYFLLERYDRSARAFRHLYELTGHIRARSDYTEAAIMARDGMVDAHILQVLDEIIQAAPLDPKARFYRGVGAAQGDDFAGAAQIWTDLVHLSPPDAEWLPAVHERINEAIARAGIDRADLKPSPEILELATGAGISASDPSTAGPSVEDMENAADLSQDQQLEMIRSMVQRLADRLKKSPDDPEGWRRLIQAYEVLGDLGKAEQTRKAATPYLTPSP